MSPQRPVPSRRDVPVSRRRLLTLALGVTAAGPLGAGTSWWQPAAAGATDGAAYQEAFRNLLAVDPEIRVDQDPGRGVVHRPRQVLVADADTPRVVARLREYGYVVAVKNRFVGVTKLVFDREVDVPAIVRLLRDPQRWPGQPAPQVQPHHVTVGFGNIMGNPGEPPRPASALPAPDPARAGEGAGVTVGVCDTGIWSSAGGFHPAWLGGRYLPQLDDEDPVYTSADLLALQGGHGTFVAGVLRQAAPGVSFDPERALAASGVGDEEMLVGAISRLGPVSVVNLSLGCHTLDDVPPLPVANAIAALPSTVAVVASAGNSATSRPAWPAALPGVVAVAAAQRSGSTVTPAPYSNVGSWVDACAVGDRTSTYVPGRLVLPGVPDAIFSGFASWAGTSFAAAYVSGRLAATMTAAGVDAATARGLLLAGPVWQPGYGVLVG